MGPEPRPNRASPAIAEIDVLWITAGLGCDGDTIAVTAATQPSIEDIVLGSMPWIPKVHFHNPFLALENGDDFLRRFHLAAEGKLAPFILVVEGSIPNENNKDEESYDFDNDVLGKALSSKKRKLSEPELHIRDSLDQFFVYIQRFERAIRNRLISQRDVYPYFGYWIGLLKNDGSIKKRMRPNARCAVIRHMVRSEFDDAGKFFFRRAWEEPDSLRMRICRLIGCGSIFDR